MKAKAHIIIELTDTFQFQVQIELPCVGGWTDKADCLPYLGLVQKQVQLYAVQEWNKQQDNQEASWNSKGL